MKQVAIVSGKGGTGKTTIAAAFAELASHKIVADCDVEAPNLHLILEHQVEREVLFQGNRCAHIDLQFCISCGRCLEVCRFGAVKRLNKISSAKRKNGSSDEQGIMNMEPGFWIDPKRCEGCAACVYACPTQAILLQMEDTGKVFLSQTPVGKFSHAELFLAADGSGKLVSEVRRFAQQEGLCEEHLIIIDGSPGIGCVVISTITGCQAALIVTEPTQSGKHDLERVLKITQHFHVPALVAINKWDLNPDVVAEIEELCQAQGIEVAGKIPFDPAVPKSIAEGKPVTQYDCPAAQEIKMVWGNVQRIVNLS